MCLCPPIFWWVYFFAANSICLPSNLHFVLLRAGGEKCTLTNCHPWVACYFKSSTLEVESDQCVEKNLIGLIDRLLHFLDSPYLKNHGKRDAVLRYTVVMKDYKQGETTLQFYERPFRPKL